MSIENMCSRDVCEIRRLTSSDSAEGVPTKTWTTAARGSLPALAVKCRIQAASPTEVVSYGLRGERDPVKLYFSSNPSCGPEDVIVISSAIYRVIGPSYQFDHQDRLFKLLAERFTNME